MLGATVACGIEGGSMADSESVRINGDVETLSCVGGGEVLIDVRGSEIIPSELISDAESRAEVLPCDRLGEGIAWKVPLIGENSIRGSGSGGFSVGCNFVVGSNLGVGDT